MSSIITTLFVITPQEQVGNVRIILAACREYIVLAKSFACCVVISPLRQKDRTAIALAGLAGVTPLHAIRPQAPISSCVKRLASHDAKRISCTLPDLYASSSKRAANLSVSESSLPGFLKSSCPELAFTHKVIGVSRVLGGIEITTRYASPAAATRCSRTTACTERRAKFLVGRIASTDTLVLHRAADLRV